MEADHPSDFRTIPIQDEIAESEPRGGQTDPPQAPPKPIVKKRNKYLDYQGNWLEKTRGNLMIVATVIASMAFQAVINPPSELWKDDFQETVCRVGMIKDALANKRIIEARNLAITCINKYNSQEFIICNTVSFSASLSIIFLLTVLPLRNKISMWILLVAMSITVVFIAATYVILISLGGGGSKQERFNNAILLYYVVFWVLFLTMVVIFVVLKVMFWLSKKLAIGVFYAIKFLWKTGKQQKKLKVIKPPATRVSE
ncbi:uncharacterized protein LOC110619579 [Manihot esculenta]|uniref:Uncharacterized protein n=2 Tax=Manihot esculenta TaxID=3983 RepID=A0ACB7HDQ7_MANES|nr:uncharacterized protein LOC110619579 [Manihot esculenta]KAG8650311.1 hypothetical protein MANES_07G025300v8 [Manihot esculenta]